MMTEVTRKKWVNGLLVALFIGVIVLPVARLVGGHQSDMAATEQRTLAELPQWSWQADEVTTFPKAFEAFFSDRFPFRDRLIRLHNYVKFAWLGSSPSADVVRGRDGWLFLGYKSAVNNHLRRNLLTERQLETARLNLEGRREWLGRHGTQYLFVVVPDKYTVYPEFAPFGPPDGRMPTRLDQLIDYLGSHSDFRIVDLRAALKEAKPRGPLYYKTNTHWNAEGAFVGYRELIARAADLVPGLSPLSRSDFVSRPLPPKGQDLAKMLSLENVVLEAGDSLERVDGACGTRHTVLSPGVEKLPDYRKPFNTTCADPTLPRAVMFRDSFGSELVPFLSEHFQHIIYEWRVYDRQMAEWLVKNQRSHLFIEEVVERDLMRAVMRGI
jgi:hypothetical protein